MNSATEASIPLIGNIFLLLVMIVLAGAVAAGTFGSFFQGHTLENSLEPVGANIEIEFMEGGLGYSVPNIPWEERATFEENRIILVHAGGTPLSLESTSILICGYGNSFSGSVANGSQLVSGDTLVTYNDLTSIGKNSKYQEHNQRILEDGYWGAGERLELFGRDSTEGNAYSSVNVKVDEIGDTSDNYGFKAGSEISVQVIDTGRQLRVAETKAIVKVVG